MSDRCTEHVEVARLRLDRLTVTLQDADTSSSLATRLNRLQGEVDRLERECLQQLGQSRAGELSLSEYRTTSSQSPLNTTTNAINETVNLYEAIMLIYSREIERLFQMLDSSEAAHQLCVDEMRTCEHRIQKVKQDLMEQTKITQLSKRISDLELSSLDGTLLWKLTDVEKRRRDAVSQQTVSVYSPAFYTSNSGYKMCARIYLNGDGGGKGTHVSLFFVIMKGSHDALLEWPFKKKVTISLLDQINSQHKQDSFRPDLTSSSFRRPTAEMNVASGFPLFITHGEFERASNGFIKDNTMFIRIVVEPAG